MLLAAQQDVITPLSACCILVPFTFQLVFAVGYLSFDCIADWCHGACMLKGRWCYYAYIYRICYICEQETNKIGEKVAKIRLVADVTE